MAEAATATAKLPQLQNLIKRDPEGYAEDFERQHRHFPTAEAQQQSIESQTCIYSGRLYTSSLPAPVSNDLRRDRQRDRQQPALCDDFKRSLWRPR